MLWYVICGMVCSAVGCYGMCFVLRRLDDAGVRHASALLPSGASFVNVLCMAESYFFALISTIAATDWQHRTQSV